MPTKSKRVWRLRQVARCACLLTVAFALALLAPLRAQDTIRVGAKNFTESAVLAELMAQAIEAEIAAAGGAGLDLRVERRTGLGGTMICWTALTEGEIDLYAEYTGTGWATILGEQRTSTDSLRTFFAVQRRCLAEHDVQWLDPFGFENTYALSLRPEVADELGIRRLSDLVAHQDQIRVGFDPEFARRADGYLGLSEAYGFEFPQLRRLEHGLAYEAIQSNVIDLMNAYSTDGKLLRFGLRVLEDDRRFFPPYHAAPVVRRATLAKYPVVEAALTKLSFSLTARDAQAMNYLVEAEGQTPAAVAGALLADLGIAAGRGETVSELRTTLAQLRRDGVDPSERAAVVRPGFFALLAEQSGRVLRLLLQHLGLTLLAIALAIAVAVPLGIAVRRREGLKRALLSLAGVVQTIPSLALLMFMIPVFGLDGRSAVAALFLYALLPILRNTCTGLDGVPADLVDAARGMGMRPGETLRYVQLPLAMPTILAGIRTATVISIGVATLVAFIGAGGLGELIVEGLSLNYLAMILLGAVPAALLAVLVDLLLGLVEKRLRPVGYGSVS
ncbi:MAG: glycine betaine ABC transporter substrate-binding protein [Planctomycetota bacterium]